MPEVPERRPGGRPLRRTLCITTLSGIGVLAVAGPAAAQAATVQSGWWQSAPLVAADVPADGLLVQGSPDANSPLAYGALSAQLDPGARATSLTLNVAPESATTPNATLAVCPLTTSFTPAQAGAKADGPTFDCSTKATSAPSSDGKHYTFDLTALDATGALDVAIVATAATDRVVLSKPEANAVATEGGSSAGSTIDDSSTTGFASDSTTSPSSSFGGSTNFAAPITDLPASAGLDGPRNDEAPAAQGTSPTVALAAQPASSTDDDGDGNPLAPWAFGGLALAAAALWTLAGQGGDPEGDDADGVSSGALA